MKYNEPTKEAQTLPSEAGMKDVVSEASKAELLVGAIDGIEQVVLHLIELSSMLGVQDHVEVSEVSTIGRDLTSIVNQSPGQINETCNRIHKQIEFIKSSLI